MDTILLNKNDKYYLDGKFYIIKSGKIISRDILENGKIITYENYLAAGEIIGNFFKFINIKDIYIPDIDIEIEAVEDETLLEEFELNYNTLSYKESSASKVIDHLIKKNLIKFFYQLYDKQGYILAILKLYNNENGFIYKKDINYENFNVSKSQFYLILSKLKKEKYILDMQDCIYLNLKKIDSYLSNL